jgi:hypothetical protein
MGTPTRTSRKAVAAFVAGLSAVACGLLALLTTSDLFLAGVAASCVLAVLLGWRAWVEVGRSPGTLTGKALAGWGMAVPVAGLVLGFLLLPAT